MGIFSQNTPPPQEKSLKVIEDTLLSLEVTTFIKEYSGDDLLSVYFNINDLNSGDVPVRLPLNIDKIKQTISVDYRTITKKDKLDIHDTAERIALLELSEYVKTIAIMVRLGQVTLLEAFLAFCYDKTKDSTFYERLESNDIKFLKE